MSLPRHALRYFVRTTLGWSWLAAALAAQTTPANDPLLQPLPEFVRPAPGQPLPGSEQQFDQLLSLAATNSPAMREQEETVSQANADRFRSWMRHTPAITASYSVGAFYQTNASGTSDSTLTPGGSFTLTASEPLWHWGGFDAQTELGILTEEKAQNDAVIAYAKLCLDLRKRYYDLIVQKALAAMLAREVDSAKNRYDKAHLLFENGNATQAHVHELELDWKSLQTRQEDTDETFNAQLADFRRLTGSSSFAAEDLPDHIFLPMLDQPGLQAQNENFEKNGVNQSLAARSADLNEKALDRKITMSNASRRPMFDLAASVSQQPYINAANNGLKFGTIFFVGVTGSWSLFDRGESFAATQALYSQKRVAENQFVDTRELTKNDADHSLRLINLGLRALDLLKSQYAQQQEDYSRVQILASTGQTEQTDLDDSRDALLDTRQQILSRQADVADAYYSFLSDIFQDPALVNAPPYTKPR